MTRRGAPIGQAWLIEQLKLRAIAPAHTSYVVRAVRRTEVDDGRTTELYPKHYATDPDPVSNLKFALKHEPFDLGVIVAALKAIGPRPIEEWIRAEPTGAFARRTWFLYETLLGTTIDVEGATTGGYTDALDDERHCVARPKRSSRHRVNDNLLGGPGFCPTVRKTERLATQMGARVDEEARELIESYDPLLLARAVNYLYTKETKSSYALEREIPDDKRAERFVAALRAATSFDPTSKQDLIALQGAIVEPRYAARDWRDFQNFVGETAGGYRHAVHYVCPRPSDVPSLMDAWMKLTKRIVDPAVDPVVAAAVASFAFVFVHPFEDGNGRLHRFLIHHVLAKRDFSPHDVIFPVSASILRDRKAYDVVLESFSKPLGALVDWRWAPNEEIVVESDSADLYRYFDATRFAEYLYDRVTDTVRRDLKEELGFVALYDSALAEVKAVLDMPDKKASLFVRVVLENNGKLAKAKRARHFAELSDDEVANLEGAVQRAVKAAEPET